MSLPREHANSSAEEAILEGIPTGRVTQRGEIQRQRCQEDFA